MKDITATLIEKAENETLTKYKQMLKGEITYDEYVISLLRYRELQLNNTEQVLQSLLDQYNLGEC